MPEGYLPWRDAWAEALYGETGFYRRPEGPAGHFRTASHAAPGEVAAAVARLAAEAGCRAVVDVGAGRGELLRALHAHPAAAGLALHGVEVVPRPPGLPAAIAWSRAVPRVADALVVAWELLDVVPCPVLEVDADGVARVVLVDAAGRERPGPPATGADLAWCASWWPVGDGGDGGDGEAGDRIEVGGPRDAMWASLVAGVAAAGGGLLLAVDYAHGRGARPAAGSLTGFRAGRAVPPRPDGSTDVTAHVALDAVAAAGAAAGAGATLLTRQDVALRALGATSAELLDPGSLGGFGWLLQAVDRPLPASLAEVGRGR